MSVQIPSDRLIDFLEGDELFAKSPVSECDEAHLGHRGHERCGDLWAGIGAYPRLIICHLLGPIVLLEHAEKLDDVGILDCDASITGRHQILATRVLVKLLARCQLMAR